MKTNLLHTILIVSIVNCFCQDDNFNPEDIVFGENNDSGLRDGIVNGYLEKISRVPYLAQVLEDGVHVCGASIISNTWLVSAAHCFEEGTENFTVITGSSKRGLGEIHQIDKIIVHEDYDTDIVENDISLIKLKDPIIFNGFQKPIKIGKHTPHSGEEIKIAGFGRLGQDLLPPKSLRAAVVPIIDADECKLRYNKYTVINPDEIRRTMFCAGTGDSDSCQGDSGGPAVFNRKLVGIISFNVLCGSKNTPSVYTRITLFRKWIRDHTDLEV